MLAIYIKKLQHKSHTLTPTLAHAHLRATLTHSHTNFGCCIKNNIVVWSTKIRKFIQRIAFGVMATAKSEANPRSFLLRFPPDSFVCATARTRQVLRLGAEHFMTKAPKSNSSSSSSESEDHGSGGDLGSRSRTASCDLWPPIRREYIS